MKAASTKSPGVLSTVSLTAVLIAWTGVVAIVALNRGIDLLWGVLIVLAAAIGVAAFLPRLQLRSIRVVRSHCPTEGVVGQSLELGYGVDAPGVLRRYAVEIHDTLSMDAEPSLVALIPAVRGSRDFRLKWTPATRGAWRMNRVALESRYPLGLARARRVFEVPSQEIVIYPALVKLRYLPLEAEAHRSYSQTISRGRGGRDEFYGVREYRPGDDTRAIHWRTMARRGEPVTREFERLQDRRVWIFLDLSRFSHVGKDADSSMEYMITIAHSVAMKAHSDGIAVGLIYLANSDIHRIEAGADRDTYLKLRDALARIRAEHQASLRTWLDAHKNELPDGGTWVLFNLWQAQERASVLSIAARHHAKPLLIEFDKESFVNKKMGGAIALRQSGAGPIYRVPLGADLSELFSK